MTKDKNVSKPKQDEDKQDIDSLKAELEVLRNEVKERDDYADKFLRLSAEFDNFRKRSIKDKAEFIKYANEGLILELVGMLDDFERSIKYADEKQDFKLLHQGVDMISKQLHRMLEEKGLKKITCVGERFNPNEHEALDVVEDENADADKVVEELSPGYTLNGRVIRPAKVKVVKPKAEIVDQEPEDTQEEDTEEDRIGENDTE